MKSKNLYCIVGPSGVGKTTIVNKLCERYGFKAVASYTTRPPRYENEGGHTFVNDEEFDKLTDKVAFAEFAGYRYCVTREQLQDCDLYVIDPAGVKELRRHDIGKKIYIIGITANTKTLKNRMEIRGDTQEAIEKRLIHDKKAFAELEEASDIVIQNLDLENTIFDITKFINRKEK